MISTALTALLLAGGIQGDAPEMRLMRFPAVHGDTVIFTFTNDLWIASLSGGTARRLTTHPGAEIRPRISPDGKWVAFTASYEGPNDLYVMPVEGGTPKRLTFSPDTDYAFGWTPEGKVAYTSTEGNFTSRQSRLWIVDPKGGMPQETKVYEAADGSFFPDGKRIAYNRSGHHTRNWRRYRGGTQGKISIFDLTTNAYSELPSGRENSWFPMVVGGSIFYVSDKNQDTVNLYRYDLTTKRDTQVTRYADADVRWPSTDGKTIVFEQDGYLHAYDIASGKDRTVHPVIKSDSTADRPGVVRLARNISYMSVSPSGARVVAEARGELFSLPTKSGVTRNLTNTTKVRERFPTWSPDGKSIAYLSDATGEYQIYLKPQPEGEATQISNYTGPTISGYSWSPDGRKIAFTTQGRELYVLDVATKSHTKVFTAGYGGPGDYDWSPDSKWIGFVASGKNSFGRINLYEVATGKTTEVTDGRWDDRNVTFDLSGKYLYFTSARTIRPRDGRFERSLRIDDADKLYMVPLTKDLPNPFFPTNDEEGAPQTGGQPAPQGPVNVRIDFDRLAERAIVLPMAEGNYGSVVGAWEGVFYTVSNALATTQDRSDTLWKFDVKSRENQPILKGDANMLSFNRGATKIAYFRGRVGNNEPVMGVVDAKPGGTIGQGAFSLAGVEALVVPQDEWRQMYWDAWKFERDNFYDANMLGMNWLAIGRKYEKYLPYITHSSEFNYVLGLLIGELGTSHAYIYPVGDPDEAGRANTVACLGADYEAVGNNVRIKKIYRGLSYEDGPSRGPLGEAGVNVNEGDYLLAIDGQAVNAHVHPNSLLVNKANRMITLTVNSSPSMAGARQVIVRPTSSEDRLRFIEWFEANRKYVLEKSGGRIGYMYFPNTSRDGQVEFIKGYYSNTDKDAIIMDERWNGGGFVQPFVVPTLARSYYAIVQSRSALDAPEMVAITGPKAMLINGYAGSGGDFTPWMFKNTKVGTLIGTRTWGGLVGISGQYTLMDGTGVTAPSFAFYDPQTGEWIAENKGVEPDIEIDARPDLVAQGRDPQLDKAIEMLMEQLRKQKPKDVKRQEFPRVGKGGG